jgi:hypothetical protein
MIRPAIDPRHDRLTAGGWARLPRIELADGGHAARLFAPLGGRGDMLSIVLCATGGQLAITFEVVERRPLVACELDPRLGQVRIDGRTVALGLVLTSRTRLTYTNLSVIADRSLIRTLRHGERLGFLAGDRYVEAELATFREPFVTALRGICDPRLLPIARWLD